MKKAIYILILIIVVIFLFCSIGINIYLNKSLNKQYEDEIVKRKIISAVILLNGFSDTLVKTINEKQKVNLKYEKHKIPVFKGRDGDDIVDMNNENILLYLENVQFKMLAIYQELTKKQ